MPSSLISSGSKRKDPRCVYLSEAKTSHLHKMWADVSSSVPHFLQMGLSPNPITHRCLLRVLCPVSRPIKTLDWVLLKDNRRALVARTGPEINSRACLWVLQGPCHNARCWFTIQRFIFIYSAYRPPGKAHVQQNAEHSHPLRACQQVLNYTDKYSILQYTVKLKTLILHTNAFHFSLHQNHRQAPLLHEHKNVSELATCKIFPLVRYVSRLF
jgi:hypothetical protein